MLNLRAARGMSMVEIAIVLAILAILMAIAVPNLQGWIANQRIRTKAESLRAGMQTARIEAMRRNVPVVFTMGFDSSWTVGCETPVADNDGDGLEDCPALVTQALAGEGGTDISIDSTPAGSTQATFSGIGLIRAANADGTVPISQVDVTVSDVEFGELTPLRILLPLGGLSRICDPAIATDGDTRKC
ncbi:MAG: GspH/FimT family pseudopilin [Rhodocyclaceae bacterium]|nr:GspH/FimT family pseudopilin [Rhodocyclaceae bacterium]